MIFFAAAGVGCYWGGPFHRSGVERDRGCIDRPPPEARWCSVTDGPMPRGRSAGCRPSCPPEPGWVPMPHRVAAGPGRRVLGLHRHRRPDSADIVALKILAADLAQGADFRKRFLREARFAAAIDHPNIVPIYEPGRGRRAVLHRDAAGSRADTRGVDPGHGALTPAETLAVLARGGRTGHRARRRSGAPSHQAGGTSC